MDRSELFNEYLNDDIKNQKELSDYQEYYSAFLFRVNGTKSMQELKKELDVFFMQNNVPSDIYTEMMSIYEMYSGSENVFSVASRLEEYLHTKVDEMEKEAITSSEIVEDIKADVVQEAVRDLENAGVNVVGDEDDLISSIESQEDIVQLKENVERTTDYLHEREQLISSDDQDFEITVDKIEDALDKNGDDGILNSVIDSEEIYDSSDNFGVSFENGVVSLNGDKSDDNSFNFMMMMAVALMLPEASNNLFDDLGLQILKDGTQTSQFRVEFGKFPVVNHPENHLDKVAISKVVEITREFQPMVDYSMILAEKAPDLFLTCQLFRNHILENDGAARIAVKKDDDNFKILFGLDEKLENVSEAFSTNGAVASHNHSGSVIHIENNETFERTMILNNTMETLNVYNNEKDGQVRLDMERGSYVKKYTPESYSVSNNNGNTNSLTLILVVLAEILAVGFSLFFLL